MLEVSRLTKRYGDTLALDGVDIDIHAGEILALLGPNGAGKTTLVSIVAGLVRADTGSARVCGIDVMANSVGARRLLGLAPQDLGIYPRLTVRENLTYFGEVAGLRSRALAQRINEVAEDLDLIALLHRKAQTLSGGEKRRVHTAMAIMHRPPLLLLDEPTTGVDVATRAHLLEMVRKFAAEGTAICYSTHYLPEVESLGANVAIIDHGQVIARGDVADIVQRHSQPALELVFDERIPDGLQSSGRKVEVSGNRVMVYCREPALEAAQILSELAIDGRRITSVQLIVPSLEAVFLALTGRRFDAEVEASAIRHGNATVALA